MTNNSFVFIFLGVFEMVHKFTIKENVIQFADDKNNDRKWRF